MIPAPYWYTSYMNTDSHILYVQMPSPGLPRSFTSESFSPVFLMDVISDFRKHFAVNLLNCDTAVSDHFAGFFQDDRPEPESVCGKRIFLYLK